MKRKAKETGNEQAATTAATPPASEQVGTAYDTEKTRIDGELATLAEDIRKTILASGDLLRTDGDTDMQAKELAELQARLRVVGAKVNTAIIRGHKVLVSAAESDAAALKLVRVATENRRQAARADGLRAILKLCGPTGWAGNVLTEAALDKLLFAGEVSASKDEAVLAAEVEGWKRREDARDATVREMQKTGPSPKSTPLPSGAACRAWLQAAEVGKIIEHSDNLVEVALARCDLF